MQTKKNEWWASLTHGLQKDVRFYAGHTRFATSSIVSFFFRNTWPPKRRWLLWRLRYIFENICQIYITRPWLAYPLRCRGYWIEYLRLLLLMCSHCGVEVTESSTNRLHISKQHTLSLVARICAHARTCSIVTPSLLHLYTNCTRPPLTSEKFHRTTIEAKETYYRGKRDLL